MGREGEDCSDMRHVLRSTGTWPFFSNVDTHVMGRLSVVHFTIKA